MNRLDMLKQALLRIPTPFSRFTWGWVRALSWLLIWPITMAPWKVLNLILWNELQPSYKLFILVGKVPLYSLGKPKITFDLWAAIIIFATIFMVIGWNGLPKKGLRSKDREDFPILMMSFFWFGFTQILWWSFVPFIPPDWFVWLP